MHGVDRAALRFQALSNTEIILVPRGDLMIRKVFFSRELDTVGFFPVSPIRRGK